MKDQYLKTQQKSQVQAVDTFKKYNPQAHQNKQENQTRHTIDQKIQQKDGQTSNSSSPFWKNKKLWIIAGVSVVAALSCSVPLISYLLAPRPTVVVIKTVEYRSPIDKNKNILMNHQTAIFKDVNTLGKDKELQIYPFSTKIINTNTRLLQEGSGKIQTVVSSGYSIQIRDSATGITISITSKKGDLNVGVPISDIISYVLSNQPFTEEPLAEQSKNLQNGQEKKDEETKITKKLTYYNLPQKVQRVVRQTLQKRFAGSSANIAQTFDAKFDGSSFKIIEQVRAEQPDPEVKTKTASLHDPANTPVITNLNDQDQIVNAVGKVIDQVLNKVKKIITKENLELMQKNTGVNLPERQAADQKLSTFGDQAGDIIKGCTGVNSDTIRCTKKELASGLMEISNAKNSSSVLPQATTVVNANTQITIQ